MTLSIAKPFVSIFKKGKSKKSNDDITSNINYINSKNDVIQQEKIEETYTVLYQVYSCRGASPQAKYEEKIIKLSEDGVFLYDMDNTLLGNWSYLTLKEFSLDENWSDWIVVLNDGTKHYFKSYESLQIHLKMQDIIRKLVSKMSSPATN